MNWISITSIDQLDQLTEESKTKPILIFKHSRSCSISKATLDRLERNWHLDGVKTYFLDLLTYRDVSNAIAKIFEVQHESPQVLIVDNGKSIYDRSHFDITFQDIKNKLQLVND